MPSECVVTYHANGSLLGVLAGTSVAYDYYPYAATEFPDKREFLDLAVQEHSTNPCLVCERAGVFAGILVLNPLGTDMHMRGTGMHVLSAVVAPDQPVVLGVLLNKLRHLVQQSGGTWYSLPRRTSRYSVSNRYRRLYGRDS